MVDLIKYSLLLLGLCLGGMGGYAQTTPPEYELVLTEARDFILCSPVEGNFRAILENESTYDFKDGTFKVDLGDGETVHANLKRDEDFPLTIIYGRKGTFTLTFSAETNSGVVVSKTYDVTTLGMPTVSIEKENSNVECTGNDIVFLVKKYEQNSSGTNYTIDFDDYSNLLEYTHESLKVKKGRVVHEYMESYCDNGSDKKYFEVKITATNECGYTETVTISQQVVIPIDAKFTFDKLGEDRCTFESIKLENLTTGGEDINCAPLPISWKWDFGNGRESSKETPELTYKEVGGYDITLKASNGYDCATDSAKVHIMIIPKVVVDFTVAKDTICARTELILENLTVEKLDHWNWNIVSKYGSQAPIFDKTAESPKVLFDDYGRFEVILKASNICSNDQKDTIIVVQKDPHISKFELPATLCPPRLEMNELVGYNWNGNEVKPKWTVIRKSDNKEVTDVYSKGSNSTSKFPVFNLTGPDTYTIKLKLTGVGCGDKNTNLEEEGDIKVYDPEIDIDITTNPLDLNICVGTEITFTSVSSGEQLTHNWSYPGASSISFVGDSGENSTDPTLKFDQYGDYIVSLELEAKCKIENPNFKVQVRKEPEILHFTLDNAICPSVGTGIDLHGDIDFLGKMSYEFNGNDEKVTWTIFPDEGYQYLRGNDTTPEPKIRFTKPGQDYKIKVAVDNVGCENDIIQKIEKPMRVRASAMTLTATASDTLICEKDDITFTMAATSVEGGLLTYNWSVIHDDVIPDDSYDFGIVGSRSEVASITFNHWGHYAVHGKASGDCGTLDTTFQVRIKKDPKVILKDTAICPGVIDMRNYVEYYWWGNKEAVTWEIIPKGDIPSGGYEFEEGDGVNSLYPKIYFKSKGNYDVEVSLETVNCRGEFFEDFQNYEVYDTTISVDIRVVDNKKDICEGETIHFENESVGIGLSYRWEVSGTEGVDWSYMENTNASSKKPYILFSKYGEYDLKVNIDGTCNDKQETFNITVRGIPDIELNDKMTKICAGASVDMSDYITYNDKKNSTITPSWVVNPTGYTFEDGYGANTETPKIIFNTNATYTLTLTAISKCVTEQVFPSSIDVIRNEMSPSFTMPQEMCISDVNELFLRNNSDGDSLTYTWNIISHTDSGNKGWTFNGTDNKHTKSPRLLFSEHGNYDVTLRVGNMCGKKSFTDTIRTYAVPRVDVRDIANVCERFTLVTADSIKVFENNDDLIRGMWTISRQDISADEITYHNLSLDIPFDHGTYQVKAEFWNGCSDPGVREFTIKVDEFIPVPPIPNDTLCHLEPLFLLEVDSKVEGGYWTLDGSEDLLVEQDGKDYFNPSIPGDYELVYNFSNGSCITSNTKKIKVHSLPTVDAGVAMEMCLNHAPKELNGLPSGGWWEGIGVEPPVFTPQQVGDTILKYYYTDENQCTNSDVVVMTVHMLPNTTFISKEQYCRGIEAEFETDLTAEKYIWAWGDKTTNDTTNGNGLHIYERHGYYDVQMIAVSEHSCVDTSGLQRIEVVNDAPKAKFSLDKHAACGPEVKLKITLDDPAVYSDHNLNFSWDFGNGNISDTLLPHNPQIYYSSLWDTTYHISFKVYNICNTTEMLDSIMVGSIPNAGLTFQHKWNCSPLTLRTKNISTGSGAIFIWDMGDGTELEYGYQPEDHLYLSDSASKVFNVTLVAKNTCGSDTVSKPLTVLAQTLEAFFETPKTNVCVGEEICFTNVTSDTSLYVTYKYWDFGDNVRDTSWNACHVYQDSGWHKVFLYVDNGCGFDTISDRIHVWALPDVNIQSEDAKCDRDTFEFSFTSNQDLQQWKWNLGDSTESLTERVKHRYSKDGDYTASIEIIAENIAFCKAKYEKIVRVHPRPLIQFTPKDTLFCPPFTYIPRLIGEAPIMVWDYGDGSEQTSALEHIYENDTDSVLHYQIVLHSESDKGCPEDFVAEIAVAYLPIAGIEKKITQGRPQKVELINTSKSHTECIWYLLDGQVDNTLENRHLEFMENGYHELSLVVYNQYSCKDSTSIEHEVALRGLYFPNTFIPHSLNEEISRFKGIGMGLQYYKCIIYDQHNNKLWETQALENGKPSEGWNGTNLQGKEMPQGIYIWRAEAIFLNDDVWTGDNNMSGNPETLQGQVLLLRK